MQGDSFNIDLSKIYYADLVGNRHIPPIPSSTINPLSLDKPVIQEKSGYTPDVDQVLISVYYEDLLKKENKLDRFINAFGKFFGGSLVSITRLYLQIKMVKIY
jgi:hypothetical protein